MKWDPTVHEDILITLFQHVTLTSEHWAKLMDELRLKGYTFSENALRYTLLPLFLFPCCAFVLLCLAVECPAARVPARVAYGNLVSCLLSRLPTHRQFVFVHFHL